LNEKNMDSLAHERNINFLNADLLFLFIR